MSVDHREPQSLGLEVTISKAAPLHMARSSQLAPNEVIGVMRDPHLIRLCIPNPQLNTGEALHTPPISILKASIRVEVNVAS